MSTEIIEAEVVPDDKLIKYASETGLEKPVTETLVHAFAPVFTKARSALADAAGVAASVKDATCVTEIRKSRACRLAIRAVRLEGEAVHKKQKESALRFGKAVDGFRNILLADLAPVEQALQEAEDTAERAEAARKATLKEARLAELKPLLDYTPLSPLEDLSEAAYAKVLGDAKLLHQAKIDAAAKAEAERLAREKADREERERINAENARLQAEAVEARNRAEAERVAAENERIRVDAERAAERRKAEAETARLAEIARKERDALQKQMADERAVAVRLQAELVAKAAAEQAAKAKADLESKAAIAAARRAAAAPDRAKLLAFSTTLRAVPLPSFADEDLNREVLAEVTRLIHWLTEKAQGMS